MTDGHGYVTVIANRGTDAIHMATALLWQESAGTELVMATHDLALGTAARAFGLRVVGI